MASSSHEVTVARKKKREGIVDIASIKIKFQEKNSGQKRLRELSEDLTLTKPEVILER